MKLKLVDLLAQEFKNICGKVKIPGVNQRRRKLSSPKKTFPFSYRPGEGGLDQWRCE